MTKLIYCQELQQYIVCGIVDGGCWHFQSSVKECRWIVDY